MPAQDEMRARGRPVVHSRFLLAEIVVANTHTTRASAALAATNGASVGDSVGCGVAAEVRDDPDRASAFVAALEQSEQLSGVNRV